MKKHFLIILLLLSTCLSAAPQAIVFDFGGVLTGMANREIIIDFLRDSFQLSPAEFDRVNKKKRLAIQNGKTDEEFWLEYAREEGIALPKGWALKFNALMIEGIGINPVMFELVDQLKQFYQVALLSNIDHRLARIIRNGGFYDPFEPCLLSCELGLSKPDPKIFEVLLKHLELPAEDVIFIDDKVENVISAKKAGIDAIVFESHDQLVRELEQRGVCNLQ